MTEENLPADKDPMYEPATALVLKGNKASISFVQRNLQIGYNRSARLIERMEKDGFVSHMSQSGVREIIGDKK